MNEADIAERLSAFVRNELLNRPENNLALDQPLITGGLIDSFSLAYIGVFIEDTFGVYIPDGELTVERMNTLEQMVACIVEKQDR